LAIQAVQVCDLHCSVELINHLDNLKDKVSKKKSSDRIKKASTPRDSPPHSSTQSLDASDKSTARDGPKRPAKGPNLDQAVHATSTSRNHAFKLDAAGTHSA
jgi:hypothetical protein